MSEVVANAPNDIEILACVVVDPGKTVRNINACAEIAQRTPTTKQLLLESLKSPAKQILESRVQKGGAEYGTRAVRLSGKPLCEGLEIDRRCSPGLHGSVGCRSG
jgi:hypothetical protein